MRDISVDLAICALQAVCVTVIIVLLSMLVGA